MVSIEELKLGNETLEALKYLLINVSELEGELKTIDMEELRQNNVLAKEQAKTLQDTKNTLESIRSEIIEKRAQLDVFFDSFNKGKADFDAKNRIILENYPLIVATAEKIDQIKENLAEAKEVLETIKPLEQKAQNVLNELAKTQEKLTELDALKKRVENLSALGLINDTLVDTDHTYSSSKINELINSASLSTTASLKSFVSNEVKVSGNGLKEIIASAKAEMSNDTTRKITSLKEVLDASINTKADSGASYLKQECDDKFAKIDQVIGVNQTTKVVTTQRAFNVFYENTTDKPIMLYIDAWNNGVITQLALNVTIGSATLTSSNTATTTAATHTNITVLIPPKTRYKVTSNGALYSWVELS